MNKGTFRLYGDLWLEDPALHLSSAALSEVLSIQAVSEMPFTFKLNGVS